ncbi:MAG: DUF484 family protein [Gammaproteobacteria bacterium]|nr:DUF484 family protein [Gammaproteobacteria bacterium]
MATEPELETQADQVLAYLRQHPQFLWDQEDLLHTLTLPHVGRGSASSLLERQAQVLREENLRLHQRISALLGAAQQNAALGLHLSDLATELLQTPDCTTTVNTVITRLREGFQVEEMALIARAPVAGLPQFLPLEQADFQEILNGLPLLRAATGLTLSPTLRSTLFGAAGAGLTSFALIPLAGRHLQGGILLGSQHPGRYAEDAGADLLDQIARLVTAALDRCLAPC